MPLRRYRSAGEMPPPPAGRPLDAQNLRRACELAELAARLFPMRYPPGLHRFRSLEEARQHREAVETAQVREARERRNTATSPR